MVWMMLLVFCGASPSGVAFAGEPMALPDVYSQTLTLGLDSLSNRRLRRRYRQLRRHFGPESGTYESLEYGVVLQRMSALPRRSHLSERSLSVVSDLVTKEANFEAAHFVRVRLLLELGRLDDARAALRDWSLHTDHYGPFHDWLLLFTADYIDGQTRPMKVIGTLGGLSGSHPIARGYGYYRLAQAFGAIDQVNGAVGMYARSVEVFRVSGWTGARAWVSRSHAEATLLLVNEDAVVRSSLIELLCEDLGAGCVDRLTRRVKAESAKNPG